MSRSIQVGDFVSVSLGEYLQYFQITDISDKIYISNVVDSGEKSAIEYESGVPKIYETDLKYQITFLSPDEYQNMATLSNLPPEIIIEIGLKLDMESLSKLCQANKMLNSILCENEVYWELRYKQDFEELPIGITDWKEEYKNAIEEFWRDEESRRRDGDPWGKNKKFWRNYEEFWRGDEMGIQLDQELWKGYMPSR